MYKDQIALIKQPVSWALESDQKTITWDLLPGGIIKDSPFLSLENATIKMQRVNQDVFRFSNRLYNYLGETIDVELINGKGISGTLIELTDRTITLQRKRSIISFNRDRVDRRQRQMCIRDRIHLKSIDRSHPNQILLIGKLNLLQSELVDFHMKYPCLLYTSPSPRD